MALPRLRQLGAAKPSPPRWNAKIMRSPTATMAPPAFRMTIAKGASSARNSSPLRCASYRSGPFVRKFTTAPVVSDTRWNARRRCAACCFARSLSTSLTPPRSPYAKIAGTNGFTYDHTPSSNSLVISPLVRHRVRKQLVIPLHQQRNRRFATVRPRLVAGLFHQKGALSSPLRTGTINCGKCPVRGVCVQS